MQRRRLAPAKLGGAGVDVSAGSHDLDRIARASVVVASPGVPPDAPPLLAARAAKIPIVSEIEVGLRVLEGMRYIAITGTNGKTTTTALVGHLLRTIGRRVADAGNIGTPLTEIALRTDRPDWIALELSSFQLHDTPSIDPAVGVLTNLSPDHLDRYASAEEYYADKALLFRNASDSSIWVLNADDALVTVMSAGARGAHRHFGIASEFAEMRYVRDDAGGEIRWNGARLLARGELPLLGDHNVMNAMAASLAVIAADPAHTTRGALARIADGLRSFRAPPHRLEIVGERGGVLWINDSKATNISSTQVAIDGMTRPTVLLLGGRHKGEPYTALADAAENARARRTRVRRGGAHHRAGPCGRGAGGATRQRLRGSHRARARRLAQRGRRRAALACVLELRHVPQLRGARRGLSAARRRGMTESPPAVRERWRMTLEARALIIVTGVILAFGLAVLYSASALAAVRENRPNTYYLLRQISGIAIGIVLFAIAAKMDAERWRAWAWPLLWIAIVLLLVPVLPVGDRIAPRIHGSRRWVNIGFVFQSSEFAKLAVIVWTAMLIVKKGDKLRRLTKGLAAVHGGTRSAESPRHPRAGPVDGDDLHADHGDHALRRRRAHRARHFPRDHCDTAAVAPGGARAVRAAAHDELSRSGGRAGRRRATS